MKVLVLNKWGLTSLPFDRWLGGGAELYLVCDPSAARSVPASELERVFTEVHVVDDYDHDPEVERISLAIGGRVVFDHVLAMSETDLVRASRVRRALGIATGQSVESAVAYRDKLVMKEAFRSAGVPTARFHPVDDYTDLVTAADLLGFPLVLKPRRGSASVGIDVINDRAALDAVAGRRLRAHDDMPAYMLAEEYIRHDLYHIDGLLIDGYTPYVWPSRMGRTLLFGDDAVLRTVTLDPWDPLVPELQHLTRAAIGSLPDVEVSLFHAEVFGAEDGRLLLNEIASRMGGGRIKASFALSHGVDLQERFVSTLALPADERRERARVQHVPSRSGGFLIVPPRPGTVAALPTEPAPPGAEQVRYHAGTGDRLEAAGSSADTLMSVTAAAPTADELVDVLDAVQAWCEDGLRLDQDPGVDTGG